MIEDTDLILSGPDGIWVDSRAYASLNALYVAVGASQATIVIAQAESLALDLTIPAEWELVFKNGGSITVETGVTLELETTRIRSTNNPCLLVSGTGAITFAQGSVLRSSWFASIDAALALTSAMQGTLIVSEPSSLAASAAVGSGVMLQWEGPGNQLTVGGTFTLSGLSAWNAGLFEIFLGAGNIAIPQGSVLALEWFNSFRELLDFLGSQYARVVVNRDYTLDADLTVPATVLLDMSSGAQITINALVTLTANCNVVTSRSDWYTGAGTKAGSGTEQISGGAFISVGGAGADVNSGAVSINGERLIIDGDVAYAANYDPSVALSEALAAAAAAALAAADATQALSDAASAQSTADGKIISFWQNTEPAAGMSEGDLWFDLDDGNKAYIYASGNWLLAQDSDIAVAIAAASDAQATADGKVTTYFSASTSAPATPADGDLWFQTDLDKFVRYNGATWDDTVVSGISVTSAATAPTSPNDGDLWYNTTDGKLYAWDETGASWGVVSDSTETVIGAGFVTTGYLEVQDGAGNGRAGITGSTSNPAADTDIRLWAGTNYAGRANAPFRVDHGGDAYMEEGFLGTDQVPIAAVTAVTTTTSADVDIYVNEGLGDDGDSGSIGAPIATLQEAFDRIPYNVVHPYTIHLQSDLTAGGLLERRAGSEVIQIQTNGYDITDEYPIDLKGLRTPFEILGDTGSLLEVDTDGGAGLRADDCMYVEIKSTGITDSSPGGTLVRAIEALNGTKLAVFQTEATADGTRAPDVGISCKQSTVYYDYGFCDFSLCNRPYYSIYGGQIIFEGLQMTGRISGGATPVFDKDPGAGWGVTHSATGIYNITHPLGTADITVLVSYTGTSNRKASPANVTSSDFDVYVYDPGNLIDGDFNFLVILD